MLNKHVKNKKNQTQTPGACPQKFTGFPLMFHVLLYNVSSTLLMLEIEAIDTYESSQPTNAYI